MTAPEAALIVARLVQDACAILLWGGFAYLAFLVPPTLAMEVSSALTRPGKLLALILFCATTAALPLQAVNLGEGWANAFNGEILRSILFESSIGPSWLAQVLGAIVVLLAAFFAPGRYGVLGALAGLFLLTHLLIGHAVMLDGQTEVILQLSYLTHVLAASAWVGALWPVFFIMRQMTNQPSQDQANALQRFSIAGHGAVILTVLSGLVNSVLIRGRFLPTATSTYDTLLVLKIALVAAMVSIALINRYVIVPRLKGSGHAVLALRSLTATEFGLALLVLIVVNVFSTMDPN